MKCPNCGTEVFDRFTTQERINEALHKNYPLHKKSPTCTKSWLGAFYCPFSPPLHRKGFASKVGGN